MCLWRIDNGVGYLYGSYMQEALTRDNWFAVAADLGLTLECIACNTGVSYSLVYRYKTGTRRPTDQWLAEVAALIEKRREEAA